MFTNFENAYWKPPQKKRISLSVIGRYSLVPNSHWLQGICARITRAHICKCLRSPGIDSEESIPPAYVDWRAGTEHRVVVPARQVENRFLGSLKGLQIRALLTGGYRYDQRMHRKYLFIIVTLPKIFISWHNPIKLMLCDARNAIITRKMLVRSVGQGAERKISWFHQIRWLDKRLTSAHFSSWGLCNAS